MLKKFTLFLALFLVGQQSYAEEWYQGGNLHGSTLRQWSVASERNKLATESDWIVNVLGKNQVKNMNMLQKKANVLVNCVDTLIPVISKSYDPGEAKSNSTALLCITQLEKDGWQ